MDANLAIQWINTTFDPPYVSALVGVSLTLLIRAAATPTAGIGSVISARIAKYRLSTFLRELTLYKFFQRNPAVLTARVLELQSWVALCVILFCAIWALKGITQPVVTAVIHFVLTAVSAGAAWIAVNLFRLVRSISRCEMFETSIQRHIARIKRRIASAKDALVDQAEVIRQAEEVAKASQQSNLEDAAIDQMPASPSPASDARTTSKQASPDVQPPPDGPEKGVVDGPASASNDPIEPARPERDAFAVVHPTNTEAEQGGEPGSVPANPLNSTVYRSEWISGRVTRWLHRRGFGYLESDSGEDFWVKAGANAGLQPLEEGQLVLFQAKPGSPLRKAFLVCALGTPGEGRVSGLKGSVGFIAIQDSEHSGGVFFRLPLGLDLGIAIDDVVGFKFGRNIMGPTANEIVAKTGRRNAQ